MNIPTLDLWSRDTGHVCYLARHQTGETARNGALAGELFDTFY